MLKLSVLAGAVIAVVLTMAAPAAAEHKFRCDSAVTGVTVRDVFVPRDAVCSLSGATVSGDVHVARNAYFQATGTDIAGRVQADDALTVFVDTGSTVGRSVELTTQRRSSSSMPRSPGTSRWTTPPRSCRSAGPP